MNEIPLELKDYIKNYLIFRPENKEILQIAVDLWCNDKRGNKNIW